MTRIFFLLFISLLFVRCAISAEISDFPENTQWLFRLDTKVARSSVIVRQSLENLYPRNRESMGGKIDVFREMFGLDPVKDVDEVVIAGGNGGKKNAFLCLTGTFDIPHIIETLSQLKSFSRENTEHGAILGWRMRNGDSRYATFPRPGIAFLSAKKEILREVLTVTSGKKKNLSHRAEFRSCFQRTPGKVLSAYADDFSWIVQGKMYQEVLRSVKTFRMDSNILPQNRLETKLIFGTGKPEVAMVLKQALVTLKSITMLRARDMPIQAALASIVKIESHDRDVSLTFPMTQYMCSQFCKMIQVKRIQELEEKDSQRKQALARKKEAAKKIATGKEKGKKRPPFFSPAK